MVTPRASILAPLVSTGIVGSYEVHLVDTVARLAPDASEVELLALALAARAPRFGHVCVELGVGQGPGAVVDDDGAVAFEWPSPPEWTAALGGSPIVAAPEEADRSPRRPLVWDGRRLYLQRYWRYEASVADAIAARSRASTGAAPQARTEALERVLDALFVPDERDAPDRQRVAAGIALTRPVSIVAGGPGTGKTRTVARLVAADHLLGGRAGGRLLTALAAPTGKAAARLTDAVHAEAQTLRTAGLIDEHVASALEATAATTVHRLLGSRGGTRVTHDRDHPLPHDLVVVDETSMVSLPLLARLLDALRPEARLVLVGDPYQLASVEAGTVMGDLVGPTDPVGAVREGVLAGAVTVLERMHRFGEGSTIAALADAVRTGDPDAAIAVLTAGSTDVAWVRPDDDSGLDRLVAEVVAPGVDQIRAAVAGDAEGALEAAARVKVLAATRQGPLGLHAWSDRIEGAVASAVPGFNRSRRFYTGRPVIVTANDPATGVANGDVGIVVERAGRRSVALATGGGSARSLPPGSSGSRPGGP